MRNLIEAFEEAKRVLMRPNSWCQGAGARDARGRAVGAAEPDARSWSLYGVVHLVAPRHEVDPLAMLREMDRIAAAAGFRGHGIGHSTQDFNDIDAGLPPGVSKHSRVISLLDLVIARSMVSA